ncbi:copper resistance protein B [Sphingomonas sp. ID1715]|uniref:copper resistance protein B n=1 Tax=Sphingomonas sp. ID1715 TaxID=1656898 RepID=UPI0018545960|nr:copper resistance protein B [Sphingomonas sp. ID1715]NNM77776.1 copper resistance protein B [Sphingomonas sp. ID1715]
MKPTHAAIAATALLTFGAPAGAQDHSMHGMNMPGMNMPAPAAKKKPAAKSAGKPKPPSKARTRATMPRSSQTGAAPAKGATAPMEGMDHGAMEGMDHSSMPGMDHSTMPGMAAPAQGEQSAQPMPGMQMPADAHSGHDMQSMSGMEMQGVQQTGTALPAGNAPAPPVPADHAADRVFGPQQMMEARHHLAQHGGQTFSQVLLNIAEYQIHSGRDGYRWDGEAWWGGDINRLWLKSEGEGELRRGLDTADVQALYSRAIDPYFNLQAGIRQDFGRGPKRTYATVGIEGLAPGFFEVEGALFLSNKGDVLARTEGYYDQRITQRLVLQPRAELNFAAQDIPETGTGSGLVDAEFGLRLRYEIRREIAPYIGVSYLRKTGDTARFARASGEDVHATSFVIGLRAWF